MAFRIHALPPEPFHDLFTMTEEELRDRDARRMTVRAKPGTPCRVSLVDAEVGETVVLVHYDHQTAASPYRAGHAIFVREGAARAEPQPNEVPPVLSSRLLSVRVFDAEHMMIEADVVEGTDLRACLDRVFEDPVVAYVHLHNAKPGCFAASATRI